MSDTSKISEGDEEGQLCARCASDLASTDNHRLYQPDQDTNPCTKCCEEDKSSDSGEEIILCPCTMETKKQQCFKTWKSLSQEMPHGYNGRRHSATGIEHLPEDFIIPGAENPANREAIHKFLSLCLRQFGSFSSEDARGMATNVAEDRYVHRSRSPRRQGSKPRESSRNRYQSPGGKHVILVPTTTGSLEPQARICRYCNREMKPGVRGLQHHLEVCSRYPIQCPNMCGKMDIPREQMTNHIIEDCPKATESCTFKHVGCSFQGSKNNLADHLAKSLEDHLQLACQLVQDQKLELDRQRERVRKQDEAIYQLTETTAKLKQLLEEQLTTRQSQDHVIQKLSEQLKEQKKHQSKFEKEIKAKLSDLEKKESSKECSLFSNPVGSGYGELIWRVSNFNKKVARIRTGRGDDPVCSEPFYTSAFGYKISCWAYLNGRGREEGRSVSVYACVMYGEYDAVLKWPIRPRYTFALMDQNPDVEDRREIVRVRKVNDFKRDDVRRKGIDRPKRDERAIIVGFDDFVGHDELETGTYLADDSFFIRVLVDITEN
ncbi:TNF receptor-associated factor 5 [Nematostella vectensis]|uniref:TNF receptor-associated factor 5 n=1 Tax=Nematostella vectensis TaxID=45351 RepID=UPI0020771E89|nr:TNF receptor-associated factor 5 [Nematostella vectensis]